MDELTDRIIRAISEKLDAKFMAIGTAPARNNEIASDDILRQKIERLDARVKELEARLDRIADAARPGALGTSCEVCGGRGSVAINPGRPDVVEPCMVCRGLGRRV